MSTAAIRQKLHSYFEIAKDKKIKALYTLLEADIEASGAKRKKKSESDLDKKYADYMNKSLGPAKTKEGRKGKHTQKPSEEQVAEHQGKK